MAIQLEVWGENALFTRPEMKTERVSYDVMTPSAARGLLESIFWHPGLQWVVDRIYVCAPIRFMSLRRNDVKETVPKIAKSEKAALGMLEQGTAQPKPLYIVGDIRQQRASLLLTNVHYVIQAHFEMTDRAAPGDNPGEVSGYYEAPDSKGAVL